MIKYIDQETDGVIRISLYCDREHRAGERDTLVFGGWPAVSSIELESAPVITSEIG
jgi:hypothetical protein